MEARMTPAARFALAAVLALLALMLVPVALADKGGGGHTSGKGGGGGGKGGSCTRNTPGVSIDNNWAWSQWGSWGYPGQQLTYLIQVRNYDVGCRSSDFVVNLSAPSGFSVSMAADTISLKSSSSGDLWAYVSSPSSGLADGDYPLTATVARAGTSSPTSSFTSYYKVYSSDSTAPTVFWPNPAPGQTISGSFFDAVVSSSDDHAVQKIVLYMDGAYVSTTACDDISYTCQLSYKWRVGAAGPHTATFKATDWMGNVGVTTVDFTVD